MKYPRTITIVQVAEHNFTVHEGEKFSERLYWEEMLGQVSAMTIPDAIVNDRTRFRMRDAGELLFGRVAESYEIRKESDAASEEAPAPAYCCQVGQQLGLDGRGCPDCVANSGDIHL